jgi:hypothetical protein
MNLNNHIPLYSNTSPDWHMESQKPSYAVDLNVGINEYVFGRTTPNNKFVVSTGLVNKPLGIEITGAGKTKTKQKKESKLKKKKNTKTKEKKDSKTKQKKNNRKALIENCKKDIDKKINTIISASEAFLKKIAKYTNKSMPNLNNAIKTVKSKKSKDKMKKMIINKCNEIGK